MVLQCEEIVNKFKRGGISQTCAIALIVGVLPPVISGSPSHTDVALESYMDQLKSDAALLGRAADRWGSNGQTNAACQTSPGGDPDPDNSGNEHHHSQSSKRNRESDNGSEANESSGENELQQWSSKKQVIFEHEMPWFANDLIAQALLHSELVQMQKSIAYCSHDFAATKCFISSSLTIPKFPDSEWDNVIRGQPINLESVFSSVNAIALIYEHSEHLRAYKIKFGGGSSRTSSKKIQTHRDWLMAWTVASHAICHAFPHRAQELQDYGNYITQQFSAISQSEALWVVSFDESIWTFVGSCNDLLLTDFNSFNHLRAMFLSSFGTHHSDFNPKTTGPKRMAIEKSPDMCNKYNSMAGCSFSSGQCKY
jgi:hypothetical protein